MTDQSSQSDKGSHGKKILNSCLITALGTTLITVGIPEILKHFGSAKPDAQNPSPGVSIIVYQSGPTNRANPAVVVDTTGKCLDLKAPVPKRPGP